jgi:hypothetical protein
MKPKVYGYGHADGEHQLHVGGITIAEGLSVLDPRADARVTAFGATGYERHGWATEKELPALRTVDDVRAFLERPALGILEVEVRVDGVGRVTSLEDGECAFHVPERATVLAIMAKVVPEAYAGLVIHALLGSPGTFFACSASGVLTRHASIRAGVRA